MDTLRLFTEAATVARYAEETPRKVPGYADLHRMAMLLLAERAPREAAILVYGAGGGLELKAFGEAQPGWRLTGIDPSVEMLELAREILGPLRARVDLRQSYVEAGIQFGQDDESASADPVVWPVRSVTGTSGVQRDRALLRRLQFSRMGRDRVIISPQCPHSRQTTIRSRRGKRNASLHIGQDLTVLISVDGGGFVGDSLFPEAGNGGTVPAI